MLMRSLFAVLCCLTLLLVGCEKADRSDQSPALIPSTPSPEFVEPLAPIIEADEQQPSPNVQPLHQTPRSEAIAFEDIALDSGLKFVYQTGATGEYLMPEATGTGAGWIDFDRDGLQDIFLVQGGPQLEPSAGDRLFRNTSNLPSVKFSEVTERAGIQHVGYGHGVSIADFDDDGFDDIYVTNVQQNVLLKNQGDGTFRDVTAESGTGDDHWSTSAAWGDFDGDGDLDLYVCNYLDYDVQAPFPCFTKSGNRGICNPSDLKAVDNVCFENLGDGRFRDRLSDWGLALENSKSLGVVVADINLDGRSDLYVANDGMPNFLFLSNPSVGFQEQAIAQGCAMSGAGLNQASMGIACEDYDENGYPDLYVTHFTSESNTLYANLGHGFRDITNRQGLHRPTFSMLGFGCYMADFDGNGLMDLFVANGHVNFGIDGKMVPQLFAFDGQRWQDTSGSSACFHEPRLGRAVASADVNLDGLPDLIMANQMDNVSLLVNHSTPGNWLSVDLIATQTNRAAIGTRVVVRCGDRKYSRQMTSGGSYCASHEHRLFFGLGEWEQACDVTVYWPRSSRPTTIVAQPKQNITIRQPVDLTRHTSAITPKSD